nr:DDE-type integrase/transposase/recombinase [Ruegeria atlantica]
MPGRRCWLWHAIDQYCVVMDVILQPKRYKRAAIRLLRTLLRRLDLIPKRLITDKLNSHGTPSGKSHRAWITGRKRVSTTAPKTATCRSENGN